MHPVITIFMGSSLFFVVLACTAKIESERDPSATRQSPVAGNNPGAGGSENPDQSDVSDQNEKVEIEVLADPNEDSSIKVQGRAGEVSALIQSDSFTQPVLVNLSETDTISANVDSGVETLLSLSLSIKNESGLPIDTLPEKPIQISFEIDYNDVLSADSITIVIKQTGKDDLYIHQPNITDEGGNTYTISFETFATQAEIQILHQSTPTNNTANTAPSISDITDQVINENANTGPLSFTIADSENALNCSTSVSLNSDNLVLVPLVNMVLNGTAPNCTLTVTPVSNLTGSTNVTLTVTDGVLTAEDTFTISVNPLYTGTPPLALWGFDDFTASAVLDSSGHSDGTNVPESDPLVERTGNLTIITDNSNSGTQAITAPNDATGIVVLVSGWDSETSAGNMFANGSVAWDGIDLGSAKVQTYLNSNANVSAIWASQINSTGSLNFTWDWEGSNSVDEGGTIYVLFIKGVDWTSPLRSSGGQATASGGLLSSGNLTAQPGDLAISIHGQYGANAITWNRTPEVLGSTNNNTNQSEIALENINSTQSIETSSGATYKVLSSVLLTGVTPCIGNTCNRHLTMNNFAVSPFVTENLEQALPFDGIDDYLSSPYNSAFDFGTEDFTITAWLKKPQTAAATPSTSNILNYTGFEGGAFNTGTRGYLDFQQIYSTGNNYQITSNNTRSGQYAFQKLANFSGDDEYLLIAAPDGSNFNRSGVTTWVTFFMNVTADTAQEFFQINLGSFFAGSIKLTIDNQNKIRLFEQCGWTSSDPATITQNSWHKIELEYAEGAGTATLYVDEVEIATKALCGTNTTTTFNSVLIGGYDPNNTGVYFIDDVVISENRLDFDPHIYRIDANGDGNSKDWNASNAYLDLIDLPDDGDTSYITSSSANDKQLLSLESSGSAQLSGNIMAVKTQALVRDEGGASNLATVVRIGNIDYDLDEDIDVGNTYQSIGTVLQTNPANSNLWKKSDLDELEIGVLNNAATTSRSSAINAMVLVNGNNAEHYVFSRYDNDQGYKLWYDEEGKITFAIDDDNNWDPNDAVTTTSDFDDNTWHHVAVVKNASSLKIYIDGTPNNTNNSLNTANTLTSNSAKFILGFDPTTSSGYFNGVMDEIRVYNYERTSEQVLQDLNGYLPH